MRHCQINSPLLYSFHRSKLSGLVVVQQTSSRSRQCNLSKRVHYSTQSPRRQTNNTTKDQEQKHHLAKIASSILVKYPIRGLLDTESLPARRRLYHPLPLAKWSWLYQKYIQFGMHYAAKTTDAWIATCLAAKEDPIPVKSFRSILADTPDVEAERVSSYYPTQFLTGISRIIPRWLGLLSGWDGGLDATANEERSDALARQLSPALFSRLQSAHSQLSKHGLTLLIEDVDVSSTPTIRDRWMTFGPSHVVKSSYLTGRPIPHEPQDFLAQNRRLNDDHVLLRRAYLQFVSPLSTPASHEGEEKGGRKGSRMPTITPHAAMNRETEALREGVVIAVDITVPIAFTVSVVSTKARQDVIIPPHRVEKEDLSIRFETSHMPYPYKGRPFTWRIADVEYALMSDMCELEERWDVEARRRDQEEEAED